MSIYRPQELRELLRSLGVSPKKGYSQNFLIDGNILKKMVDLAHIQPGDDVLEIGAGPGALTEELLKRGAKVIAVEKDPVWAEALKRFDHPDLTILQADILTIPLESLLAGKKGVKVVANLPYHITTPILIKLVSLFPHVSSFIIMVQDEVARRYTSLPGNKEYGSITIFLNFWAEVKYGFKVKKTSFYPAPKVDSAVVLFNLKEKLPFDQPDLFFKMTREAFNYRRKMLKVSLGKHYTPTKIQEALTRLDINPASRPEDLSLGDFIRLFKALNDSFP